jgi:DNA-binding transcriptional MerR regulator
MFRIGDFSQLGQVSIRTLRLYDELNLLKPAQIDKFTGYRYYTIDQLPRLNRILALKDLGLSLDQIGDLLKRDLPADQLPRSNSRCRRCKRRCGALPRASARSSVKASRRSTRL